MPLPALPPPSAAGPSRRTLTPAATHALPRCTAEYLRNVRSWKGDDTPPLPAVPQRRSFDRERAIYARWAQHEAIVQ